VTVRPATVDDAPAVARLEAELFGADAWSPDGVRSELSAEHRIAVVAEVDGAVAGYVVVMDVGDTVDLLRIGVHASYRRRGLARELLAAVAADRMLLEVGAGNEAALAFYAAEGFVEIDRRRRYYRDGSDAVVMQRVAAQ
jgi:[ribosomal protein S18]-alanine N-acetyltransferase